MGGEGREGERKRGERRGKLLAGPQLYRWYA